MNKILDLTQVKDYFQQRIDEHGASPRGSDWNSEASQQVRFDQLLKVIEGDGAFSLLDYGWGWGALVDSLVQIGFNFRYTGYDILEHAIAQARKVHAGKDHLFTSDEKQLSTCDYVVESGIFNYRGDQSSDAWIEYVLQVLNLLDKLSRKGFSCNFLTKYSDSDHMRPDLYYDDPGYLFDHC
jgi:cyclopropane fatty-acyl-phospholipid synthase-like methyltransferase